MIFLRKKFIFKTAHIILDDEGLQSLLVKNSYSFVSAISYLNLNLPGWRHSEKNTALIDLTGSEEEIFKKFNDTTRNEVRKSMKNPDLSFSHNTDLFEKVFDLYAEFEKKQGRKPMQKDEARLYVPFCALYKGKIVSGQFLLISGSTLRIRSIFSRRLDTIDKEMEKMISNASRGLMWEICRWGRNQGYSALDVASVNDSNVRSANIARFKMSFGGEIVREHTYTYESPWYRLFSRVKSLIVKR